MRSWIWMAAFSAVFLGVGVAELVGGAPLPGIGYLFGGIGGGMVTVAHYRGKESRGHRALMLTGMSGMFVAIVLLGIDTFG